jgi:hypothetical protein
VGSFNITVKHSVRCVHIVRFSQERALQQARAAWGDDDMDDDLEDIMASLKVCCLASISPSVAKPLMFNLCHAIQAPDHLFSQPQLMSQMQRAYTSSFAVPVASALPTPQPYAAAAPLPPLPRPSAAVAYHSAALAPALSVPAAAPLPPSGSLAPQSAANAPPPALLERNRNQLSSAPDDACTEDDVGSAWGITDPRTLAALKKREAKFKGKDAARRHKEVSSLRRRQTLRQKLMPCRRRL